MEYAEWQLTQNLRRSPHQHNQVPRAADSRPFDTRCAFSAVVVVDVAETGKFYIATAGYEGLVALWEPKKAPEMGPQAGQPDRWEKRAEHKFSSSVLGLAVCTTPLSTVFASGGLNQHVAIWDMRRLCVRSEHKRHHSITCLCASSAGDSRHFNADSRHVNAGSRNFNAD